MQAPQERTPPEKDNPHETPKPPKADDGDGRSAFACNICFDSASDPVVTKCGHLYCWPCIHSWLEVHANKDAANCPVCKSGVYKADLIPIYGRGKEKNEHAMFNAPPRPAAQRVDPVRGPAFPHQWNGNMGGNFTFTAGFGFFPMFNMQFNTMGGQMQQARHPIQDAQQSRVSQLLFLFGTLVVLFLLILG